MRHRRDGNVGVSLGEATKTCLSRRGRRCVHVVLRGRRGIYVTFKSVSGGMCVHDHREGKVAVSMDKVTKRCLSRRGRRCVHIVLRGRCGTL